METIKKGDKVKMSSYIKDMLNNNGCEDHIEEFGECIGIVGDPTFPNNAGPEVDVYWEPGKLKYCYDPTTDLIKINE